MKSPLICGAILLGLATSAFAVPKPPKSNSQVALLQQQAKAAAQRNHLQQAAASARQHQILANHARNSQQQLLRKAHENFFKLHLIEQARRSERNAANDDRYAPVTRIQRD